MESEAWSFSHDVESASKAGVIAADVRDLLDQAFRLPLDEDEDTGDEEDTFILNEEIPQERSRAVPATASTPPSGLPVNLETTSSGRHRVSRPMKVQWRGDLDSSAKLPFAGRLVSSPKAGRYKDILEHRLDDLPKQPDMSDAIPLTPGRIVTLQDLQQIVEDIDYGNLEARLRGGARPAGTVLTGPIPEELVRGEEASGENVVAGVADMYGGKADDEDELMAQVCAGGCRFVQLPGASGDINTARRGGCLDQLTTKSPPLATSHHAACRPPSIASEPPTPLPTQGSPEKPAAVEDDSAVIAPEDDVLAGLDVFVEGAGDELLSYVFGTELEPLPEQSRIHIDSV